MIAIPLALAAPAGAEVPLPARKPSIVKLPDRKPKPPAELPPHPKDVSVPDWTEAEISEAGATCERLLGGIEIVHEPVAPLRRGRCGAPAPVKVSAVGERPPVEIAPAPTLRCKMAAAVGRWLAEVVQPAARSHLGQPVTRIRNAASYVCRPRYNDRGKRISEHALANALDIAAFRTRSGAWITVLEHWPHAQETRSAEAPAPDAPGASAAEPGNPAGPKKTDAKGTAAEEPKPEAVTAESTFLRTVYDGACGIFGTALGPDANEAHRDHFHFDLKQRRTAYCR